MYASEPQDPELRLALVEHGGHERVHGGVGDAHQRRHVVRVHQQDHKAGTTSAIMIHYTVQKRTNIDI